MKLLFTLCLSLSASLLYSQDSLYHIFPLKDGRITYEKVITLDTTSQVRERVKNWALSYYRSQKDVLQIDEAGTIAYKGYFALPYRVPEANQVNDWQYWHTLKILIREGKAKIIVTDLSVSVNGATFLIENYPTTLNPNAKGMLKRLQEKNEKEAMTNFTLADQRIKSLITSLEKAIVTPLEF